MKEIHNEAYCEKNCLIVDLNYQDIFNFKKKKDEFNDSQTTSKFYIEDQINKSRHFDIMSVEEIEEAKDRRYVLKIILPTICFAFLVNLLLNYFFSVFCKVKVDAFNTINTLLSTWLGFILGRYFKTKG